MNENDLYSVDFTRSLPTVLKDDPEMYALGRTIAEQLQAAARQIRQNIIYARIDELDEQTIDILAYDLHVDWYDYSYPIEVKRRTIKDSVKVHRRLGTKYAVETALGAVFPETRVEEWFEYEGRPYTFRVIINLTDSDILTVAKQKEVLKRLNFYKNLRSHLDEVRYILIPEKSWATVGGALAGSKGTDSATIIVPPLQKPGGTTLLTAGGGFAGTKEENRVLLVPPELHRPGGKKILTVGGCFAGTREEDRVKFITPELERPGCRAVSMVGGCFTGTRRTDHANIKVPILRTHGREAAVNTGGAMLGIHRRIDAAIKTSELTRPRGTAETGTNAGFLGSYRKFSIPVSTRGAVMVPTGRAVAGSTSGVFHTYQRIRVSIQTNL